MTRIENRAELARGGVELSRRSYHGHAEDHLDGIARLRQLAADGWAVQLVRGYQHTTR